MRFTIIVLVIALTTACGSTTPTAPSIPTPTTQVEDTGGGFRPLSTLSGTWKGGETATHGESGSLTMKFTQQPSQGADIQADITWVGDKHQISYTGRLEGTLANMTVNTHNATPSYSCVYKGVGSLNTAGDTITGTYTAEGAAPCPSKTGRFSVTRQGAPPPPEDPQTVFCHVPPGNPSNGQTLTLPQSAITNGHIPQHPLDHYGACTAT